MKETETYSMPMYMEGAV